MAERYFQRFPNIVYSNSNVVDITKRVKLLDTVSNNPYVFYTYDIGDSERPDNFSARYYNDPYMSWSLYIGNNIIDPYYEWYLTAEELEELIDSKYGSVESAKLKIKYYRNNWEYQEEISISAYNSLNDEQRNYWEEVYKNGVLFSYKRKEVDWIATTNKLVSYNVANTNFIKDEICDIVFSDTLVGRGQVVQSSNGVLNVYKIVGNYNESVTANSYVYGRESGVNTSLISVGYNSNNINSSVENYYLPITYYEYESNKNEFNRTIRVIDSEYKYVISENLRNLLEE